MTDVQVFVPGLEGVVLCRVEVLDSRKFHQLLVDPCALSSAVYVSLWAALDCILVLFIQ